ncbi:MAG: hypothetical protein CM1200mP18_08010 [Gammaproteobacteria bacterium]|nr:MAG: hypothetical protein CM1200mP18_08010 [Gammaproteobacteria bacterium]
MKSSRVYFGPRYVHGIFECRAFVYTHVDHSVATAVLYLPGEFVWAYGEMLGLSSVGLILFGVGSLPAGWFGIGGVKLECWSFFFWDWCRHCFYRFCEERN